MTCRVPKLLVLLLVVSGIVSANPYQAQALDIDELCKSVVVIKSGGRFGSGIVVEVVDRKAFVLTAGHNVKEEPVTIEFYRIYDSWKGTLIARDERNDVALLVIEQSPNGVEAVRIGQSARLNKGDEICAIVSTVAGGWNVLRTYVSDFQGGDIYFAPTMGERTSGGPLVDSETGYLVGMIKNEIWGERERIIMGVALKAEIVQEILDGWRPEISRSLGRNVLDRPVRCRLSISWHRLFFGEMLPFVQQLRWKLSRGTGMGLSLEVPINEEISPHKFGILYSSYRSEPAVSNPTGTLISTFIIPFWRYEPLLDIRGLYFAPSFAFGLGIGTYCLENGRFLQGGIEDCEGERDSHTRLAALIEAAFKYYLIRHLCVSLGWRLSGSTVRGSDVFYHGLYLAGAFRVSL